MFMRSLNLQDMCLIAVVRDINFFINNKTIPQKNIDFLFRAYSGEVFSKHKVLKDYIDEDSVLWFLNPHVKKVTLKDKFCSEKVLKQLKIIVSEITSLNLRGSHFTENELNSIIAGIPCMVHIDISNTCCSDEMLKSIRDSCPNLETLNVSGCENISDTGMENLCGSLLSLKNLNVLCTEVEAFGIVTILNGMPSLECLKCDELAGLLYELFKNKQVNLTELLYDEIELENNTDRVIQALAKICPKLKKLHFEYPVDKKVLKACSQLKNLEELKLKMSHKYFVDNTVNEVLPLILPIANNLKTLILTCAKISVLTLVDCFKNLEYLSLKKVSFIPFKKEDVKNAETNLLTLVIKDIDMKVDDTTYKAVSLLISLSKNVTNLHLNHISNLPPELCETVLKSMNSLTYINFDFTFITLHSLNPFFEIPSMTTVISNNFIDEEDISSSSLFAKKASCTLSWRSMFHEDEDEIVIDESKYFYDETTDESISDACYSTDSDDDDRFFRYGFHDYDYDDNDYYSLY